MEGVENPRKKTNMESKNSEKKKFFLYIPGDIISPYYADSSKVTFDNIQTPSKFIYREIQEGSGRSKRAITVSHSFKHSRFGFDMIIPLTNLHDYGTYEMC
ncbi:hypothetical protein ACOSP7_007487 [Xanthoceras sorbifolium]